VVNRGGEAVLRRQVHFSGHGFFFTWLSGWGMLICID